MLRDLKRYSEAMAELNGHLMARSAAKAYRWRASLQSQLGHHHAAIADLAQALAHGGPASTIYGEMGLQERILKDYRRAVADYQHVVSLNPKSMNAWADYVSVLMASGDIPAAEAATDRGLEQLPNSIQLLTERAQQLEWLGNSAEALAAYTNIVHRQAPQDATSALTKKAKIEGELGRYDDVITDSGTIIGIEPNNAVAYSNRGLAYYRQDKDKLALADLNRAVTLRPNFLIAHQNRTLVLNSLGRHEEAMQEGKIALSLPFPLHPSGIDYFDRAITYETLHQYHHAIRYFSLAISHGYLKNGWTYFRIALDHGALRENAAAIAAYSNAIAINPNFAWAYHNRADIFWQMHRRQKAATDYARARTLDPTDAKPVLVQSYHALAEGNLEAAGKWARETLAMPNLSTEDLSYTLLLLRTAEANNPAAVQEVAQRIKDSGNILSDWPGPLLAYLQGNLNLDDLQKAAEQGDAHTRIGQQCELSFYLAQEALALGQRQKAIALLKAAAATPYDPNQSETFISRDELAHLRNPAR